MNKYYLGLSSAVALLAATAAVYHVSPDRQTGSARASARPPTADREASRRSIRADSREFDDATRLRNRRRSFSEGADVDAEALEENTAESSVSMTPEQTELEVSRHEEVLVQALAEEPRDVQWARETEAAVSEALQDEKFRAAKLVDAECRSTLCRVELSTDDGLGRDDALAAIPMSEPFATDGLIRQRGDDEGTVVVFFARAGNSLRPS